MFYENKIVLIFSPITYAWHGGNLLSKDPDLFSLMVSKEEYDEEGFSSCLRFDI